MVREPCLAGQWGPHIRGWLSTTALHGDCHQPPHSNIGRTKYANSILRIKTPEGLNCAPGPANAIFSFLPNDAINLHRTAQIRNMTVYIHNDSLQYISSFSHSLAYIIHTVGHLLFPLQKYSTLKYTWFLGNFHWKISFTFSFAWFCLITPTYSLFSSKQSLPFLHLLTPALVYFL